MRTRMQVLGFLVLAILCLCGIGQVSAGVVRPDLGVLEIKVQGTKIVGKIANFGNADAFGGRRYRFARAEGQKLITIQQGVIGKLKPMQVQVVEVDVSSLKGQHQIYLQLAGVKVDVNKQNDVAITRYDSRPLAPDVPGVAPSNKYDLAATDVQLVGRRLIGVVVNNGPGNFPGGGLYQLGTGANFVQQKGDLPAIAAKRAHRVEFTFASNQELPESFAAFLTLTSFGDNEINRDNNSVRKLVKTARVNPAPPPVPSTPMKFDLVAQDVKLVGRKLIGVIANNGPGNFSGGGLYQLGTGANFIQQKGPMPAIPAKQSRQVVFTFAPNTEVPPSFAAFLTIIRDDTNANNNSVRKLVP